MKACEESVGSADKIATAGGEHTRARDTAERNGNMRIKGRYSWKMHAGANAGLQESEKAAHTLRRWSWVNTREGWESWGTHALELQLGEHTHKREKRVQQRGLGGTSAQDYLELRNGFNTDGGFRWSWDS